MSTPFDNRPTRPGRWPAFACLAVLVLLPFGKTYMDKKREAEHHFSASGVCKHALQLASTLGGSFQVIEPPCFYPHSPYHPKEEWLVVCQSGEQKLYLTLDDATGLLDGLAVGPMQTSGGMVAPIRTPAQAREVALHRIQELQVMPRGSLLTLAHPPALAHARWYMTWSIQSPRQPQPYRMTVMLDKASGLPVLIGGNA